MTIKEAKDAVLNNTVLRYERQGVSGYAHKITYCNEKGKASYVSVECHSLQGNSVFCAKPEDLTVDEVFYGIWENNNKENKEDEIQHNSSAL